MRRSYVFNIFVGMIIGGLIFFLINAFVRTFTDSTRPKVKIAEKGTISASTDAGISNMWQSSSEAWENIAKRLDARLDACMVREKKTKVKAGRAPQTYKGAPELPYNGQVVIGSCTTYTTFPQTTECGPAIAGPATVLKSSGSDDPTFLSANTIKKQIREHLNACDHLADVDRCVASEKELRKWVD